MSTDEPLDSGPTHVAAAVVTNQGRLLVGRRPLNVPLAGYAEFPGGKVEEGESLRDAATRECREETGLLITVEQELDVTFQQYDHGDVEIHFFHATVLGSTLAKSPYEWVPLSRIGSLRFPPANEQVLLKIRQFMEE